MNKRGSVLAFTLVLVAVLAALSMAYGLRIFSENAVMVRNVYSTQAFWISEAGIQKAAWDYNHNDCQGMTDQGTGSACTTCVSCGTGPRLFTGTLATGDFSVTFDPLTRTYVSTGSAYRGTGANRYLMAQRKIRVNFGRDHIVGFAAFSQGELTISNGSTIDSYNSGSGAYDPSAPGANGNVGTNGTAVNVIDIGNNATINGSVSTGPGGTVDYKPGKVTITGGISHANDIYIEPVTVPDDLRNSPYLGTLTVSGTENLSTGKYRYDQVSIGNNGTLNINGDVELYLTSTTTALNTGNNTVVLNISAGASLKIYAEGVVSFGNKAVINNNTANQQTSNLAIFSLYSGADGVSIRNNNEFYGLVYAPLTDVTVGNNSAFYGAVVGETVSLSNNGMIHYDEALGSFEAPWQPVEMRDWQEQFD